METTQSTKSSSTGPTHTAVSQENQPNQTAKKTAYFWMKAKPGDVAFRSSELNEDREVTINQLQNANFNIKTFDDNKSFLNHISTDHTGIDLLVVSGHGNPFSLEDLEVKDHQIVSNHPDLSLGQRAEGLNGLKPLLKESSVIILQGCMTGNKSEENNFARTVSKTIPQSKVFASQYNTVGEPMFFLSGDKSNPFIDNVSYATTESNMPLPSVIYQNGEELTQAEAVPVPFEYRQPARFINSLVTTLTSAGTTALTMFNSYRATNLTSSVMNLS